MECQTCNGMRFVLVERPKRWYQSGTSAVIGTHKVNEPCEDCDATGLALDPARNPDCGMCHGRGERNAWDMDEYTVEQCDCENPALVPAAAARQNIVERLYIGRKGVV